MIVYAGDILILSYSSEHTQTHWVIALSKLLETRINGGIETYNLKSECSILHIEVPKIIYLLAYQGKRQMKLER